MVDGAWTELRVDASEEKRDARFVDFKHALDDVDLLLGMSSDGGGKAVVVVPELSFFLSDSGFRARSGSKRTERLSTFPFDSPGCGTVRSGNFLVCPDGVKGAIGLMVCSDDDGLGLVGDVV